jgi:excisionase family DNA binding protein
MHQPTTKRSEGAPRATAKTLLTTREAAARLDVTERTVRRAIVRGELPAFKHRGAYRIPAAALETDAPPREIPKLFALPPAADGVASLPVPPTTFVGRTTERAEVAALLRNPDVRLLTLTGPGGIGKTRLAIAAAGEVEADFPDGVAFVDLAAIAQDDLVLPAIAAAMGVAEAAQHDLLSRVCTRLSGRRLLLVLDNFEHVLEAAPVVSRLLRAATDLTVLVTSRIPLRLAGERELQAPTLSLPGTGEPVTAETLLTSDAGRLFVERARAVDAAFVLDERNAAAVAEICAMLDGLPLAIELATARLKTLPPGHLRERLERRLPLLTGAPRDAAPRHATMRDAVAWSYDLASPDEQRLFRRLAVFAGGFTLDAVEGVALAESEVGGRRWEECFPTSDLRPPTRSATPSSLDVLASLIDQSLLVREIGPDGEPRYRMLETIREFGLEQLDPAEEAAARTAHAGYFLRLASALRPLVTTRSARAPLDRLEAEEANLRAALDWLAARGPVEAFAHMVAACYTFLFALSHFAEAETWLTRGLEIRDRAAPADRARLAVGAGELLMVQGIFSQAAAALADGVALVRELDDAFDLAMALISRGASLNYGGEYAAAEPFFHEALIAADRIADPTLRAAAAGRALANLGVSARGRGDLDLATARGEEALARIRGKGLDLAETRVLMDLGDVARNQGNSRLAVERYLACITASEERRELRLVAEALDGIASVAGNWGLARAALLLFGAAGGVRERIGYGMLLPLDVATRDRYLAGLLASLGEESVALLLAEGRALTLAEAIGVAATVADPAETTAGSELRGRIDLTARERDVLRLLVARRTDREIADALFLSPRTVNWHVARILGKLGASSRRDAATVAITRGLA